VLGARVFHILAPPESMIMRGLTTRYYLTHMHDAFAIWKGGLDRFGAVAGGALALYIFSRFKKKSFHAWFDTAAPGACLVQSISSWGLYFNQELYGRPTRVPWAIEINPGHRLSGYQEIALYHPLFLYYSLWSLISLAVLLGVERIRKVPLPQGAVFYGYLFLFGIGQFGLEFFKLDVSRIGDANSSFLYSGLFIMLSGWGLFRTLMVNQKGG
jgi:phosphatidylglycerol:prolipoprotein diacylglycerol transferase